MNVMQTHAIQRQLVKTALVYTVANVRRGTVVTGATVVILTSVYHPLVISMPLAQTITGHMFALACLDILGMEHNVLVSILLWFFLDKLYTYCNCYLENLEMSVSESMTPNHCVSLCLAKKLCPNF